MNPTDLTITDWQELLTRYRKEHPETKGMLAVRIENTSFSVARFYGGMFYESHEYTYFEPRVPGTTEVAWFCVRDDFLRWVSQQRKEDTMPTSTPEPKLNSPHVTAENFVRLFKAAHAARAYQKQYFAKRDGDSLTLAKRAERELDALIDEFQNPPKPKQEELF